MQSRIETEIRKLTIHLQDANEEAVENKVAE